MTARRKTILTRSAVAFAVLTAAFVIADYFGMFGVHEDTNTDFVEFRVRTIDATTGRAISDVKVRCFQYTTNNACAQPPSRERGVVRISLLVERHVESTLLFDRKIWYTPVNEDELRVMYIHTEYAKPVKRYNIPDLMQHPNQIFTVEMKPLVSAESGEQ